MHDDTARFAESLAALLSAAARYNDLGHDFRTWAGTVTVSDRVRCVTVHRTLDADGVVFWSATKRSGPMVAAIRDRPMTADLLRWVDGLDAYIAHRLDQFTRSAGN